MCVFVWTSVVRVNFGLKDCLCDSGGMCGYVYVRLLGWCVSSSPPPARDHDTLYAEVNDLAVQSHSPARTPLLAATGGLANWCPAE